ncbi:MAG: pyridoxal-phosphate dependent enzyme [Candidatus Hodarchaeales archaeon]
MQAIKISNGLALSVSDEEIRSAMSHLAKKQGIMVAPEAAATISAVKKMQEENNFESDESIVLFSTGSGLTTPDEW